MTVTFFHFYSLRRPTINVINIFLYTRSYGYLSLTTCALLVKTFKKLNNYVFTKLNQKTNVETLFIIKKICAVHQLTSLFTSLKKKIKGCCYFVWLCVDIDLKSCFELHSLTPTGFCYTLLLRE